MAGDREISIALPNKYLVEDSMNPGGMSTAMLNYRAYQRRTRVEWIERGGGMIFRMGGPGGQQLSPEQMEASLRRIFRPSSRVICS